MTAGKVGGGAVPALVVTPEAHHGVALYARQVAADIARLVGADPSIGVDGLDGPTPPARAHLHFTDRLWGSSPEAAAERIAELARRTAVTVTLHDLPQPSDGPRNLARRAACYARVVAAAEAVVVNSRHEAALLEEHSGGSRTPVGVIPLPVLSRGVDPRPRPEPDGSVAIVGFFYPGKGHAEMVDAVAELGRGVTAPDLGRPVTVGMLGRASAGHERELEELVASARDRGVPFELSGWLDDEALRERCRRASVPVAAHRHVSASGSLATWIAAGRRPLVPATRYSREMDALRPGTLTLVDPDRGWADAIGRALEDPASTWLDEAAVTRPHLADTATSYLRWFDDPERFDSTEPFDSTEQPGDAQQLDDAQRFTGARSLAGLSR